MDNQTPTPPPPPPLTTTTTTTTATSLSQPPSSQPPPPPLQPQQPPPSPSLPPPPPPQQQQQLPPASSSQQQQPPSSVATPSLPNPNLRPSISNNPSTSITQSQSQIRPQLHSRPTLQQHPHFQHFSSISSPSTSTPSPTTSAPSPSQPRAVSGPTGGVAIGVPATSPVPFSSSFSQVRPMSTVGVGSQIRPGGIGGMHQHHIPQPRSLSVPSSVRGPTTTSPNSPNTQSPAATQSFQGHGFMRPSSVGPGSPATSASQSMQSPNQPWLSSGSQGKPPLHSPSFRPQTSSQSLQHRSHIPQPHHPIPPVSQQQQQASPAQTQQSLSPHQPLEHFGQPFPQTRAPRSITQQLALQNAGNQRLSSLSMVHHPNTTTTMAHHPNTTTMVHHPNTSSSTMPSPLPAALPNTLPSNIPMAMQPGAFNRIVNVESEEFGNRILSKRSIHELVTQVNPSEKLDPEVEDILADIADDFVESITTFGCSLAKHRKSDTLEAKDILLHLERNWNITLPGFSGDEIKTYRKPITNDLHKERLAVVKKSMLASEMAGAKNSIGQAAAANARGNLTRAPANAMISPT